MDDNNEETPVKTISNAEILEFNKIIKELRVKIKEMKEQVDLVKQKTFKVDKGISLLDIKYHTLLQYITNLCYLVHLKLDGKSIKNHPVIINLVELRVVLEKIKPIEQKLKYQIDKLIRSTLFGKKSDEIYKAPKLAPVHFEEKGVKSKQEKERARILWKASNSRLVQDLMLEYDDRPEESDIIGGLQHPGGVRIRDKVDKVIEERNRYEEENFIRLNVSKKEKRKAKMLKKFEDEFENLDDFKSLNNIRDDVEAAEKE
ncbi:13251_t:CDS:2, partial [Entrophospora sp. SA101]